MGLLSSLSLRDCVHEFRQVLPALINSAKFCWVAKVTNYDFPYPAWKIAIGSLSASVLATGLTSCSSLSRHLNSY